MVKKMKYPGLKTDIYYIFDDARIWSTYKKGFISQHTDRYGYLQVSLIINGNKKQVAVHKLMEYNFMDMSLKKNFRDPTIDHIDSNKLNNRYTNLRYLERGDNAKRGKHYYNTYHHHKLEPEDVHLICQLFTYGWKPKEIMETLLFNISELSLRRIYKKEAWKHIANLYIWNIS